jgi:hypothetical protein
VDLDELVAATAPLEALRVGLEDALKEYGEHDLLVELLQNRPAPFALQVVLPPSLASRYSCDWYNQVIGASSLLTDISARRCRQR